MDKTLKKKGSLSPFAVVALALCAIWIYSPTQAQAYSVNNRNGEQLGINPSAEYTFSTYLGGGNSCGDMTNPIGSMYDPQPQILRFPDALNYNNCDDNQDYSVTTFKATSTITIRSIAVDFLTFTASSTLKIDAYVANYDGSINATPEATAYITPERVYSLNFVDVSNALIGATTRKRGYFNVPITLQPNQTVNFRFTSDMEQYTFVYNSVGGVTENRYQYCCSVWSMQQANPEWGSGTWNKASSTVTTVATNAMFMPFIELSDVNDGAQNGVCGADHFYCVVGESTSYVGASSTAWIWTCDGINGGAVANCSEPFAGGGSTSTPNAEYPTVETYECGITSGAEILGCLKTAFVWAFVPPQSSFDQFYTLMNTLKKKPPMGYLTAYADLFRFTESNSSSTLFILVQDNSPYLQYIFTPLRGILLIVVFLFAGVWFFRRVKNIVI